MIKLLDLYKLSEGSYDAPGEEDSDANNDGQVDDTDLYVKSKRSLKKKFDAAKKDGEDFVPPQILNTENTMIKLKGLISLPSISKPVGSVVTNEYFDDGADSNVSSEADRTLPRAQLLSLHKQTGELFNMLADEELLESWQEEKLAQAVEAVSSIFNAIQYEKTNQSSLGNGEGSEAAPQTAAM